MKFKYPPFLKCLAIILSVLPMISSAQTPNAPHSPTNPLPQWVIDNQRKRDEFERRTGSERPEGELRRAESKARSTARLPRDPVPVLSEKDRKRIESLKAPNPEDLIKYKDFLSQDGTGIFRLFPDFGCESKGVIRVDGDCANQVSGASSHSFRGRTTSHDLRFQGGDMIADGFFSLPIMASLGNIDLENIKLESNGVKFLAAYEPSSIFEAVKNEYSGIRNGQKDGEFLYVNRIKPVEGHTYAVRVIAYDIGNTVSKRLQRDHLRGIDPSKTGVFSMLKFDNRKDMIVAFRVIRRDDDGNISILWKELSKKSAPKIVFDDKQAFSDFK